MEILFLLSNEKNLILNFTLYIHIFWSF